MQEKYEDKARGFWTKQKTYPKYGTIKQRRLHELNFLVPKLDGFRTIIDLGAGDGALCACLERLTDIETYHMFDIGFNKNFYDCNNPTELPNADATILAGVIPFMFSNKKVLKLLEYITSEYLFLRAPCATERTLVDDYSEQLGEHYTSLYRTVDEVRRLLESSFDVEEVSRVYPDDIESKFGTKQYYFVCKKRS